MSDMHIEVTGEAPARQAGSQAVWKVLTVLLAVACAVLAFLLLRPTEAEAETGPTATGDSTAALACEVLGEVVTVPDDELESDAAFVETLRLNAAGTLGMLAEEQDGSLVSFAEQMQGPARAFARTFSMDSPELHEALDLARETCADRFPADE